MPAAADEEVRKEFFKIAPEFKFSEPNAVALSLIIVKKDPSDDVRIGAVRPLITPALLQERVPVRDDTLALVEGSRAAIAASR